MTTPAQHISRAMPAIIALLLVVACALPMGHGVVSLTPNIAWLMTMTLAAMHPSRWSPAMAFGVGLLQDVLFATPLGAQALLSVLLLLLVQHAGQRQQNQPFRVRWLEVALVLIFWHGLLWALMAAVTGSHASSQHLLLAGVVNALWYPLCYFVATRTMLTLPSGK